MPPVRGTIVNGRRDHAGSPANWRAFARSVRIAPSAPRSASSEPVHAGAPCLQRGGPISEAFREKLRTRRFYATRAARDTLFAAAVHDLFSIVIGAFAPAPPWRGTPPLQGRGHAPLRLPKGRCRRSVPASMISRKTTTMLTSMRRFPWYANASHSQLIISHTQW